MPTDSKLTKHKKNYQLTDSKLTKPKKIAKCQLTGKMQKCKIVKKLKKLQNAS